MPTIDQIRAARALIGWSQGDLAEQSGLSQTGIARIENGTNQPNSTTISKIRAAFDKMGLVFIPGGVQKVQDTLTILEGKDCLKKLQDDVYHTLKPTKGEVLLLGIDEVSREDGENFEYTLMHIERMKNAGISERILVKEDEDTFIAPLTWYRSVPSRYFSPYTVFVYDSKIALTLRDPHNKVLLLDNIYFADSLRSFFDMLWDGGKAIEKS